MFSATLNNTDAKKGAGACPGLCSGDARLAAHRFDLMRHWLSCQAGLFIENVFKCWRGKEGSKVFRNAVSESGVVTRPDGRQSGEVNT